MKVVALVSGGKDSCFAMMKSIQFGHEIVALANLMPADDSVDELDSYMYQTVGHQIIVSYAECMGIPLFRRRIQGSTRHQKLNYRITPGDEVEDMYILLKEVKRQLPSVSAVCSGAIASDYQRLRVESVCSRLGLVSLAYLWKQDQSLLLHEMINNGILAITVKVAAMGLDPMKHLGKELSSLDSVLHKLNKLYGINVCGEGGEYETLTLDCPLFKNARIVLDESKVVMHSSDSIAPVGFLHPISFHLEYKAKNSSICDNNSVDHEKVGLLFEIEGDCFHGSDTLQSVADASSVSHLLDDVPDDRLQISCSRMQNTFAISCWLQDSRDTSSGLQDDLKTVLRKIESELLGRGYGWKNVLYIHLYLADMDDFALANETYVSFITQEKCPFGVPSRSTIELPLLQVRSGNLYIEVLVANDQSKRVLHVQSISSWAPSCIGPYSQATLHKEILYMAGQLGLNPPTMTLCSGGATHELEQALKNCEAVSESFNSSISTSSVLFITYCSTRIQLEERKKIEDKLHGVLEEMRHSKKDSSSKVLDTIYLYIHVPNLPKGALVEVKPVLYVQENFDTEAENLHDSSKFHTPTYWGFQHEDWHKSCIQKCVVNGNICAVVLSVTNELARNICSSLRGNQISEEHLELVSKFCICLLNEALLDSACCWEDIKSLRFYLPTSLNITLEAASIIFSRAFNELAESNPTVHVDRFFNLIPVLGAGRAPTSMDDILTCELFAQKS
ncbi:diphthine--ammonia ligase isoform X1 [Cucurbita moschata]|uniref:Diphthine--ammonia ligase n=1 Tax=Cucurbita moschata TaxID=3662 RepID=A0A6J1FIH5_CUCMO|nr:diphthine--ammonia ligase isoform X1 [Cucurbita moschata]